MALTAQTLAAELGVTQDRATELLGVVTELVNAYAASAPEAVRAEATLRAAGWLAEAPSGGQRSEEQGDIRTTYTPAATGALRHSGAMGLLSPWKQRRGGVIG